MPLKKVLILGGTREATTLAKELHESGVWNVTTSLAGRTKDPAPVVGHVRIGGFGGASGLADFIRENNIDLVIDATHPFARTISQNAAEACKATGTRLDVRTRSPWEIQPGDNWKLINSLTEAAEALPANARVFLALGRQYLGAFKDRSDCHFIIRMVDEPEVPLGFSSYEIIAAKPSQDPNVEADLFRQTKAELLVCRNSGGEGAYAKIIAARTLGLPVIMLDRN